MTRASQFHNNTWYLSLSRTNNYQNNDVIFPYRIDKFIGKKRRKNAHLVKSRALQPFAKRFADTSKVRHRLLAHGLGNEISMLLRCARHCCLMACWFSWNLKTLFNETLNVGWTLFDGKQDVNRFLFSTWHTAETLLAWMTHKLIIKK